MVGQKMPTIFLPQHFLPITLTYDDEPQPGSEAEPLNHRMSFNQFSARPSVVGLSIPDRLRIRPRHIPSLTPRVGIGTNLQLQNWRFG
jgi:hypothetical protein